MPTSHQQFREASARLCVCGMFRWQHSESSGPSVRAEILRHHDHLTEFTPADGQLDSTGHAELPHAPGAVLPGKAGGYFVGSRTAQGAWWLVWGTSCSCPATVARCWHVQQVEAYCRAEDAKHRRPAAVVDAGIFCD